MSNLPSRYDSYSTLTPEDVQRLSTLQERVEFWAHNISPRPDGMWTLRMLSDLCGGSEASASARLRSAKKRGFDLVKLNLGKGLWIYRLKRRAE